MMVMYDGDDDGDGDGIQQLNARDMILIVDLQSGILVNWQGVPSKQVQTEKNDGGF